MIEHKVDDIRIYNTCRIFDNIPKEEVSYSVAKWVVNNLEKGFVAEIFEKNYEGFSTADKKAILIRIYDYLSCNKVKRINDIKVITEEYLKENKRLNMTGFARFRLQRYREYLKKVIDNIIERFLIEKEYDEFISLIKEYLIYQERFINHLNVFTINNRFVYMDEKGKNISDLLEKTFIIDENLSQDDKLLTILILCNPETISWHLPELTENNELIKTVISIFENSVEFCNKCEHCIKIKENRLDIF